MKSYSQFKKEVLKNKRAKKAYDALGTEFEFVAFLIKRRLQKKLTQRELAERVGTKQSAIARLESGRYNPSLNFLYRITNALDAKFKLTAGKK